MNKCLLFETLNEVRTLQATDNGDGLMHLSGVFGVCGVRNNNKRVYTTENYKRMVESMQERLKKAPIPGELEHPKGMNVSLENVSHRIDSINIDENGVVSGDITLLNTPKGQIAQAIVKGGLPLFISSRAEGSVDKNGIVTLENLQTYDLVGSPGFSQAEMKLNEGTLCESLSDNIYYIYEENKNNDMTNEQVLEELKALREEVETLRGEVDNYKEQSALYENDEPQFDLETLCESVQNWFINECAPEIQKWMEGEFVQHINEQFAEKVAPSIEQWIVEEFAPEHKEEIKSWVLEEYSEQYSNGLQKWIAEEYSSKVQEWLLEQYSPEIERWIVENVMPEMHNQVKESFATNKQTKLGEIDSMIAMLEGIAKQPATKPNYTSKVIREDANEPVYIAEMPAESRIKWNMASNEVKESIQRRAKLYDFTKEGAIEKFWESADSTFTQPQTRNINEGLDNINDSWEKGIRLQFRNRRK